ncbi:MAG: 4Fe-4S binding protein [Anaerolineaceae bacterium]|nr:4Fe-4S binding protein [Anaerolineaceae bacterium]
MNLAVQRGLLSSSPLSSLPSDPAKYLEKETFQSREDENIRVKLPFVDRDLCIGCGICENKCPVQGQAAIRVSPTGVNDAL